jgi:hypothetical protein
VPKFITVNMGIRTATIKLHSHAVRNAHQNPSVLPVGIRTYSGRYAAGISSSKPV